jgi:hypothetical protein
MVWDLRLEHISLLIIVYPYFTYPVNRIALTASIFTTVSIAHDRYLATKHPIHHRQQFSEPCDQKRRLLKYFIPNVIISVFINIPTFLEYDIVYAPSAIHQYLQTNNSEDTLINQNYVDELVKRYEAEYNESTSKFMDINFEDYEPWIYVSEIAFKHAFEFDRVYHWICLMLTGIIPFVMLSFFNIKLFQEVKRTGNISDQKDHKPTRESIKSIGRQFVNETSKEKQEIEMAKVLIGIVVIFLLCHFLKNTCDVVWGLSLFFPCIDSNEIAYEIGNYEIVCGLGKLLIVINSSINMIIYCFINKRFREDCLMLSKKCFCWKSESNTL